MDWNIFLSSPLCADDLPPDIIWLHNMRIVCLSAGLKLPRTVATSKMFGDEDILKLSNLAFHFGQTAWDKVTFPGIWSTVSEGRMDENILFDPDSSPTGSLQVVGVSRSFFPHTTTHLIANLNVNGWGFRGVEDAFGKDGHFDTREKNPSKARYGRRGQREFGVHDVVHRS